MWINLFFQIFIWKPCTWLVKMIGQMKLCPDKWPTWLDTVHWPAISLSAENRQLNQKNKLCMLLKSIPALWLIHKQTKKIPHHDPIMQRIKNYCSVLGSYCLPSYLQSNVVLNLSSQLYEYHKLVGAYHVMMMMMMMMIMMMVRMMMISMIKITMIMIMIKMMMITIILFDDRGYICLSA